VTARELVVAHAAFRQLSASFKINRPDRGADSPGLPPGGYLITVSAASAESIA
jgi:hypothetical protein